MKKNPSRLGSNSNLESSGEVGDFSAVESVETIDLMVLSEGATDIFRFSMVILLGGMGNDVD